MLTLSTLHWLHLAPEPSNTHTHTHTDVTHKQRHRDFNLDKCRAYGITAGSRTNSPAHLYWRAHIYTVSYTCACTHNTHIIHTTKYTHLGLKFSYGHWTPLRCQVSYMFAAKLVMCPRIHGYNSVCPPEGDTEMGALLLTAQLAGWFF